MAPGPKENPPPDGEAPAQSEEVEPVFDGGKPLRPRGFARFVIKIGSNNNNNNCKSNANPRSPRQQTESKAKVLGTSLRDGNVERIR